MGWKGKRRSLSIIVDNIIFLPFHITVLKIIRKVMLHLQKYSLSFDTEDCSYYADGGPRKHTDPVTHVNVVGAVMNCNIQQL